MTLDAGALIAADRNDRRFWTYWRLAMSRGVVPTIPAPVLAQVWRGARSARLAQLLAWCDIEVLDEALAKRTGLILGRSRTSDVVDASVMAGASIRGDQVLTTDRGDLTALTSARGRTRIVDLRDLPSSPPRGSGQRR